MASVTLYGATEVLMHLTSKALDYRGSVNGELIQPAKITIFFNGKDEVPEAFLEYAKSFKVKARRGGKKNG